MILTSLLMFSLLLLLIWTLGAQNHTDEYLAMDGDSDRDPHWSTGLSSQGPNEEQKEGEHEQESQDVRGAPTH